MQTYLVDKTENSVTLGFKDANLSLITPIMDALYADENIAMVRYLDEHPELVDRKLYVEVKEGDPIKTVMKAADTVAAYFSS